MHFFLPSLTPPGAERPDIRAAVRQQRVEQRIEEAHVPAAVVHEKALIIYAAKARFIAKEPARGCKIDFQPFLAGIRAFVTAVPAAVA